VRPTMCDEQVLRIVQGRHPMVDAKMGSGYVPNDVALDIAG
jgi:DNA mismatch repair ATPase MutS